MATVSHELRTPVAAIIGTIETISRLGEPSRRRTAREAARRRRRLRRAAQPADRGAADRRRDRAVGDDRAGGRRSISDAFVDRVVKETAIVQRAGASSPRCKPVTGRVRTDEAKLHRVLVNLIENAAKYAPEGPIEVEAMAAGARLLFFVTDHGPGIAAEDRDRVLRTVRATRPVVDPVARAGSALVSTCAGSSPSSSAARSSSPTRPAAARASASPSTATCRCRPTSRPSTSAAVTAVFGDGRRAPPMSASGKRLRLSEVAR